MNSKQFLLPLNYSCAEKVNEKKTSAQLFMLTKVRARPRVIGAFNQLVFVFHFVVVDLNLHFLQAGRRQIEFFFQ